MFQPAATDDGLAESRGKGLGDATGDGVGEAKATDEAGGKTSEESIGVVDAAAGVMCSMSSITSWCTTVMS